MAANKNASGRRKYGKKASDKVAGAMRKLRRGTLRSGSGQKVETREQAIAIGLSEAKREGGKVPSNPNESKAKKRATKKAAPRKNATKKAAPRKNATKKAAPRKNATKKAAPKKRTTKKAAPKKRTTKKVAPKKNAASGKTSAAKAR